MDISEKNLEETIEQALLTALPQVELNPSRLEIGQPAPLYGALTANLASGDVVLGGYNKRRSEDYDKTHCLLTGDVLERDL